MTETGNKIKQLKEEITRLEEQEKKERQEQRKKDIKYMERQSKYEIVEIPSDDELWNTSEVFKIRIVQTVKKEDCPDISDEDFKSIMSSQYEGGYPRRSIEYLISRKLKMIVGRGGGGYVMLGSDMGLRGYFAKDTPTDAMVKKLVEDYLSKL